MEVTWTQVSLGTYNYKWYKKLISLFRFIEQKSRYQLKKKKKNTPYSSFSWFVLSPFAALRASIILRLRVHHDMRFIDYENSIMQVKCMAS